MFLAHADKMDRIDWGSPVGVAVFMTGLTLSFFLFSLAVKNFDAVDRKNRKK